MDDAQSPLEAGGGGGGDISAPLGQLKVADAAGMGLPAEVLQQLGSQQAEPTEQPIGLEADLQIWRQYLAQQGSDPASAGELQPPQSQQILQSDEAACLCASMLMPCALQRCF